MDIYQAPVENWTGILKSGATGWVKKYCEQLEETDTIILGRVTYEAMAKYWTVKPLENHFPRQDLAIADKMNQHTKVVFSKTLKKSIWHRSVFATGNPKDEIKQLKEQEGKDMILFGSASLASTFILSGMVDEYPSMDSSGDFGKWQTSFQSSAETDEPEIERFREF